VLAAQRPAHEDRARPEDAKDAEWIAKLIEHRLVRPSFIPPQPIRQLRDLTRYRTEVVRERTRQAKRLHNPLEDAGIKITSVVSDVLGKSGRPMLEALIAGEHIQTRWLSWPWVGYAANMRY
jgi:transposase